MEAEIERLKTQLMSYDSMKIKAETQERMLTIQGERMDKMQATLEEMRKEQSVPQEEQNKKNRRTKGNS